MSQVKKPSSYPLVL